MNTLLAKFGGLTATEIGPNLKISAREVWRNLAKENYDEETVNLDISFFEALEPLLCNSDLEEIHPEETGDLTEAPILGILGETQTQESGPYGVRHVGYWGGKPRFAPILKRWAYTSYQVKNPLQELINTGEILLIS
jgi:hypothetical protein